MYNGSAIAAPQADNFTTMAGTLSFTWYKGSVSDTNILTSAPRDAGSYILKVDAAGTENVSAASLNVSVEIRKAELSITAADQTITYGEEIVSANDRIGVAGLQTGDALDTVTLVASGTDVTDSGTITPENAVIKNGSGEDVTANYDITYELGKLVIQKSTPTLSFKEGTNLNKTYDGQPVSVVVSEVMNVTGAQPSDVSFTWYRGSVSDANKLTEAPAAAGTYVLVAEIAETSNTNAAQDQTTVTVSKRALTVTAEDQEIIYGESIDQSVDKVESSQAGLADGDSLTSIVLTASSAEVGTPGTITPSAAVIKNAQNEDVQDSYDITYADGSLTVYAGEYNLGEDEIPVGLTAVYGQTLADVVFPGSDKGSWEWQTPTASVGDKGTKTFKAVFTPADTNYKPAAADVQVTVNPAVPTIAFTEETEEQSWIFTNTPAEIIEPTVTLVNNEVYEGEISYSYHKNESETDLERIQGLPTEAGSYIVYAEIEAHGNYTKSDYKTCCLNIEYLSAPTSILYDGAGKTEWYNAPVAITADGYTISDSLTGTFEEQYTIAVPAGDEEVQKNLYFKNASGQITDAQTIAANFDVTAPTGRIEIGAKWWENVLNFISFGKYRVQNQTVTITASDDTSKVAETEYYIYNGDTPYTDVDSLKEAGLAWKTYSNNNKPGIDKNVKTVVYARLTDNAGNVRYISSDGILLDTEAPVISSVEAVPEGLKDTEASIEFGLSESAAYYYAVLPKAEPAPAAASVIATVNADAIGAEGGSALDNAAASGSGSVTDAMLADSGSAEFRVTGLQANTDYTVYIVAVDRVLDITSDVNGAETGNVGQMASCEFRTALADISKAALTITGEAVYRETLTASVDWSSITNPGAAAYQWYRGNTPIAGAVNQTYTLSADDIGQTIRVEVTAENCSGALSAAITSEANGAEKVEKADCPDGNEASGGTVNDTRGVDTFQFTGQKDVVYEYSLNGGDSWADITEDVLTETDGALTGTIQVGNDIYAAGSVQVRAKETEIYKAGAVIFNRTAFTAELEGTVTLSGEAVYGETLTAQTTGAQNRAELVYSFYRSGRTEAVQTGSSREYTLTAEDIGNTISVTVTAAGYLGELKSSETAETAKRAVTITANSGTKVYGGADPELTYVITSGSLADGDVLNGALTREAGENKGSYRILQGSLTGENNPCYVFTFVESTFTITPITLTWDTSDLTAADREGSITDRRATLYGSLKVSGILSADTADAVFTCPADKLIGTYASTAAGTQRVTLTWADAASPATLQGEKAGNYVMPTALPEITGTINPVTALPTPPESTDSRQYRLEAESGISEVPEALKNIESLNTPAKIEAEMKLAIQRRTSDIPQASTAVYDVTLMININGTGWVPATEENFPAGGITVTLPYPSGTGRNTHDFTVAHMFTADANGMKAGDIEYPAVTKTDAGIRFKVSSLSPISVGWKAVTQTSGESTDAESTQETGGNGGGSQSGSSSPARTSSAPTGDSSPIALYLILLAAAVAGIGAVVVTAKRKRNKE